MRLILFLAVFAFQPPIATAAPSARFVVWAPAPFAAYGEDVDLKAVAESALTSEGCTLARSAGENTFVATVDAGLTEQARALCEYSVSVSAADGALVFVQPHVAENKICSTVWLKQEVAKAMRSACKAGLNHHASGAPAAEPTLPLQPVAPRKPNGTLHVPVGIGLVAVGVATFVLMAAQHGSCEQEVAGVCKRRNEGLGAGAVVAGALGLVGVGGGLGILIGGKF